MGREPSNSHEQEVPMQEKPFTPLTPVESENWLKEHAGSWRRFLTVPRGFVFSCCGEVKGVGNNHEEDIIKAKDGWVHKTSKCREIILMGYPAVMDKESNFRRWQIEEVRKKIRREERRPYFGG